IEPSGANQFRELHQVRKKKSGEKLLDEITCADLQDDLPFGPITDVVGVTVDDRDKSQLQREPEQFDNDPEHEVCLELHLADHGVAPERAVNSKVAVKGRGLRTRHSLVQFC